MITVEREPKPCRKFRNRLDDTFAWVAHVITTNAKDASNCLRSPWMLGWRGGLRKRRIFHYFVLQGMGFGPRERPYFRHLSDEIKFEL
jgi:hypothetical protein